METFLGTEPKHIPLNAEILALISGLDKFKKNSTLQCLSFAGGGHFCMVLCGKLEPANHGKSLCCLD